MKETAVGHLTRTMDKMQRACVVLEHIDGDLRIEAANTVFRDHAGTRGNPQTAVRLRDILGPQENEILVEEVQICLATGEPRSINKQDKRGQRQVVLAIFDISDCARQRVLMLDGSSGADVSSYAIEDLRYFRAQASAKMADIEIGIRAMAALPDSVDSAIASDRLARVCGEVASILTDMERSLGFAVSANPRLASGG